MLKSVSSLQYYKVCVNVIIMEFKYYPSLIIAYGIASLILNLFCIICLSIINFFLNPCDTKTLILKQTMKYLNMIRKLLRKLKICHCVMYSIARLIHNRM